MLISPGFIKGPAKATDARQRTAATTGRAFLPDKRQKTPTRGFKPPLWLIPRFVSFVTWSVLWSVAPQRPRPHHDDSDELRLSTRNRNGQLYTCEFRPFGYSPAFSHHRW